MHNRIDLRSAKRIARKRMMLLASAASLVSVHHALAAANTPIAVTGWNQDVIAETTSPVEATSAPAFPSLSSLTKPAVLYYYGASTGLPASGGSFVSASNSATTFQLQPYNANDAILLNSDTTSSDPRLAPYGDTGTLTFTNPASYGTLEILATSAAIGAASNSTPTTGLPINYTITFTDATAVSGSFTPTRDNTNAAVYALNQVSSVARNDPAGTITSTLQLFESDLSIPVSSQSKLVQSIQFTGSTAYNGSAVILAVSGSAPIPSLTWKGATSSNWDTSTAGNWQGSTLYTDGSPVVFNDAAPSSATAISITSAVSPLAVELDNNTNNYSFTGAAISGSASLTMNGLATTTLNSVNTYTGATTVNSGLLVLGPSSSIASKSIVVGSSGTLNISSGAALTGSAVTLNCNGVANVASSNLSLGSVTGTGTLNLSGTALSLSAATTFAGSIRGTGQLILNAATSLTGTNTYSGGTTLNTGATIAIIADNTIGTGPLIFNGGVISNPATNTHYTLSNAWTFGANANASGGNTGVTTGTPYTLSGPGTLPAGTNIFNMGGELALSGPISGPGILEVGPSAIVSVSNPGNSFTGGVAVMGKISGVYSLNYGRLYLQAANAYTGPTTVATGGLLEISDPAALGSTSEVTVGSTTASAEFVVGDNSGYAGLSGGTSGGAPIPMTIYGNGNYFFLANSIPAGSLISADGTTNTWSGTVQLGAGGAGIGSGTGGTLILNRTISSVDSSPLLLGTQGGSSTIVLNGSNTYTGDTVIDAQAVVAASLTVRLGNNSAIPAGSGVNFNTGTGTLDINGSSPSVKYISGSGLSTIQNGGSNATLTINNGSTGTAGAVFSGTINGSLALVKSGAGNQTIAGPNSYTLGTTVSGGTLTVTQPTGMGSGPVTLSGGTLALNAGSGNVNGFSSMALSGIATTSGSVLTVQALTPVNFIPGSVSTATAFTRSPVSVLNNPGGFTASFLFNPDSAGVAAADGIAFTIQNDPATTAALGDGSNGVGYGANGDSNGIQNSFAIMLHLNASSGTIDTYEGMDGANPFGFANLANSITEPVQVTIAYNASANTITEKLVGQTTGTTSVTTFSDVGLGSLVSNNAYVGFTASAEPGTDPETISNFTFNNSNAYAPNSISNSITTVANTNSSISASVSPGVNQLTLGTINIAGSSKLSLVNTGSGSITLTVPGLTIAGATNAWTGQLDLGTTSLIVSAAGSAGWAQITNQLKTGYNSSAGYWNGSGIVSSSAASDPSHLTAIGILLNEDGTGHALYGSGAPLGLFEGASPNLDDVLLKYTYYGDADLSGSVNSADYTDIDNGYLGKLTGWQNGDFNYDNIVNGSDYTLIDNAFNMQGTAIAAELATPTGEIAPIGSISAVPEPGSSVALLMAAASALSRRRAKRSLVHS